MSYYRTDWPRYPNGFLASLMIEVKDSGLTYIIHTDESQYIVDPNTGAWIKVRDGRSKR